MIGEIHRTFDLENLYHDFSTPLAGGDDINVNYILYVCVLFLSVCFCGK